MRVVHVVQALAIGGQEVLIVRLSQELRRRGHAVSVVAFERGGALVAELEEQGVSVVELARRRGFDPRLYSALGHIFAASRPDVVHTHNVSPLIYGAPIAYAFRARVVHTKHGIARASWRTRLMARLSVRFVSRYVCVSEEAASVARRDEGAPPGRLSVIRNGIDTEAFRPTPTARTFARRALGLAEKEVVVGTVARLAPEKDLGVLVEAVARLPGVRLVIIGDGPERARIEARAGDCLGGRAIFPGARRDGGQLVHAFDVFALSSLREGVPLALLEAMAAERPVVATAVGGVPSVVTAAVGALVPPSNPEALAEALAVRLASAEMREREGRAGRRRVEDGYSLRTMTDAYEALYRGEALPVKRNSRQPLTNNPTSKEVHGAPR